MTFGHFLKQKKKKKKEIKQYNEKIIKVRIVRDIRTILSKMFKFLCTNESVFLWKWLLKKKTEILDNKQ